MPNQYSIDFDPRTLVGKEISLIPDEEDDGFLDPGTLLLVLNKLAKLCQGEALDPQTGELLE